VKPIPLRDLTHLAPVARAQELRRLAPKLGEWSPTFPHRHDIGAVLIARGDERMDGAEVVRGLASQT
jgi:hypothetical protein